MYELILILIHIVVILFQWLYFMDTVKKIDEECFKSMKQLGKTYSEMLEKSYQDHNEIIERVIKGKKENGK